jgi:ABC-type antimicrobial peptide transport system permease subunit
MMRLGRATITGAGTMLGIAFLMSVFSQAIVAAAKPGVVLTVQQQQKNLWLVVMSLLVTFVGITNSMLMSVTERYKEIGTIKCLGALDSFIVKLFLLESGLLGFFGSVVGATVGLVFVTVPNLGLAASLDWGRLILYFLMCIALGTLISIGAAIPPALRAAKMQAIDAMRTEV